MNNIKLFFLLCILGFLSTETGFAQNPKWEKVAPGVWKTIIGTPDDYNLLKAAGSIPLISGLDKMAQPGFPLSQDKITFRINEGKVALRFPLQKEEQIFGFGLNFQTIFQRGKVLELHVDHYGGKDNGRTHAPVPFYVSDRGYGVFVNAARYIKVWCGSAVRADSPAFPEVRDRNTDKKWSSRPYSDAVEMLVPANGVEVYVFEGPTALDAVRRFNLFNGGGCLPPRWGLGFTQRVKSLYTADEVRNEVKAFNDHQFPLDFIGLEPGWQSKSYPCTFDWDKSRYPDPAGFVKEMKDQGIRLNLWTNPYVSPESPIYEPLKPFYGSHTVWLGQVPDITIPEAAEILGNQLLKSQVEIGVSGYKIDEVDGYDFYLWPDMATFPSGKSAEQMRQTYGILIQKLTADIYHHRNERTYGLVRASNGGASNLPYVIYNDYYSHEDFITALCNSSFAGVLWTPEARNSKTAEEWLRRIQSVCFSPMAMINAWSSGTKPWSFPEVEKEVKDMANLRMALMPYFYSEFAKYHFEGTPPFRAMYLEPGFTIRRTEQAGSADLNENPYAEAVRKEMKDQYMAGENLLVAPMFSGQTGRKVVLPEGKWFDFYTGKYAGAGEVITVEPGLAYIPVFVKDGALIPMMKPQLQAPKAGEKVDLEIRHYGTKEGLYRLYDDDGETFDYENGAYSWRELKVETLKNGKSKTSISSAEKGKPDNLGTISWKEMTTAF
ncbi:MAG TPA: ABC transporter substrate-binding protein [Prolixibacteraceae bacterium]|nr:ABC transporter substrate-binding protein [Prolixibacteraceae bacterium]